MKDIVLATKEIRIDSHVIEVLLPDLVGHDRRPAAFVLYVGLWAMTRGVQRKTAFLSYQMLADRTGLSKTSIQRAAAWLERRQLIRVSRRTATSVPEYAVLTPWLRG